MAKTQLTDQDPSTKTFEDIARMVLRTLSPGQRMMLRSQRRPAIAYHRTLGLHIRNRYIYPRRYDIIGPSGEFCWGADMESSKIVKRLLEMLTEEYPLATSSNPRVRARMLTLEEARRALYIDFEGNMDMPPTLLGVYFGDVHSEDFKQVIHEPGFSTLADGEQSPSVAAVHVYGQSLGNALTALKDRALAEDRRVIAWSSREAIAIRESGCDNDTLHFFEEQLIDAKIIAKQWKKKTYPHIRWQRRPRGATHSLDRYMELVGYRVPYSHGPGKTGARLRNIRERLEAGKPMTKGLRGHWTKLLNHNFHDCRGMRAVTVTALGG
jgi:hypothetical protein